MNWKHSLVVAAMVLVTGTTAAQQIFKSIGPDGKPVYTDQPPPGTPPKAVTSPPPPLVGAAGEEAAGTSAGPARGAAKRAARAHAVTGESTPASAPPASAPAARVDPAVERAVSNVMALESLVLQTEELCVGTLPTSAKKYSAATAAWKERNANAIAQERRVAADAYSAAERQALEKSAKALSQQNLAPVVKGTATARIKWCDESAEQITRGSGDVNASHVTALSGYQGKK